MKEILPGVYAWSGLHEEIGQHVNSYFFTKAGVLVDPILPADGFAAFDAVACAPQSIILLNRGHDRDSARMQEHYGCSIWLNQAGIDEVIDGGEVEGFDFGDEVPGGFDAVEIGGVHPEETALFSAENGGLVVIGDAVIRQGDGPLSLLPDEYLGELAQEVKHELKETLQLLARRQFRHLLLTHGEPMLDNGRQALQELVATLD